MSDSEFLRGLIKRRKFTAHVCAPVKKCKFLRNRLIQMQKFAAAHVCTPSLPKIRYNQDKSLAMGLGMSHCFCSGCQPG